MQRIPKRMIIRSTGEWWSNRWYWLIAGLMIGFFLCHLSYATREIGPTRAEAKAMQQARIERINREARVNADSR
jgi:hypothetical protein